MVALKYRTNIITLCLIVNVCPCVTYRQEYVKENRVARSTAIIDHGPNYSGSEEKLLENALRDIAYYLRNHKFNEWDRRYYKKKPAPSFIGFYEAFPTPGLQSLHWEVSKHCYKDFFRCIAYLHNVIKTTPFTRSDDITTTLNKRSITFNFTLLEKQNEECKKALFYTEVTGLPFSGTKEKFHWRTSASYYMCWYTMKGIPALSMLGESCDNFANCLDNTFGNRNRDPRADDKLSFACAMYSFCPDPCCPLKHVHTFSECYNSIINPCYVENYKNNDKTHRTCRFSRQNNQNLAQIMENRWNVTCQCQQKGFVWSSEYGMCVDINECTTKKHNCDLQTEDCLNLPGTFQCVCKWGHVFDKLKNECIESNYLVESRLIPAESESNDRFNFMDKVSKFFQFVAL